MKNRSEAQLLRDFGMNAKPRGLSITKNDHKPEPKKKCCK